MDIYASRARKRQCVLVLVCDSAIVSVRIIKPAVTSKSAESEHKMLQDRD